MQAPDPGAKLRELVSRPLVKVCGLTREEDVAVAVEAGADLCGFILEPASPRAADAVLPVPDTVLSVAVFVGEAEEADADLVQLYPRQEGKVRGRDGVLLRDGEQVATVADLPWQEEDPDHLSPCARCRGTAGARGRPRPGQRRPRDRGHAPVGGRRELVARGVARNQGPRPGAGVRGGGAMSGSRGTVPKGLSLGHARTVRPLGRGEAGRMASGIPMSTSGGTVPKGLSPGHGRRGQR